MGGLLLLLRRRRDDYVEGRGRDGAVPEDDRPDDEPHVLFRPVAEEDPLRTSPALRTEL